MEPTIEDELQKLAAEVPDEEWKNVPRSDDKLVPLARVLALVEAEIARLEPEMSAGVPEYLAQSKRIHRLLREEFEPE